MSDYAQIDEEVSALIARWARLHQVEVVAYMVMRAAMLTVRARRSAQDASAIAYKLADEMATEKRHD